MLILRNLKTCKQIPTIASPAVICRQHVGGYRLSKSAGSAHTDVFLQRIHHLVAVSDQTGFVYINFRIDALHKLFLSRIHITSHAASLLCPVSAILYCIVNDNIICRSL